MWVICGARLWPVLLAALVLYAGAAQADNRPAPVLVDSLSEAVNLGSHLSYLVDENGELALADVLEHGAAAAQFAPLPGDAIRFGYDSRVYWVRFAVHNGNHTPLHLYLEARYPLIDHLDLHVPNADGTYRVVHAGDRQPFFMRPLPHHEYVFPLELPGRATQTIYLRLQTTSSLDVPLFLSAEQPFLALVHDTQWLLGLVYGVIFGLLAYNSFIFMTTREKAFLYYVLYLVMTFGYMAAFDGVHFRMFPEAVTWQQYSIYVCANGSLVFLFLFSIDYLQLRREAPRLYRLAQGVLALNCLSILSHLVIDITLTPRIGALIGMVSFVIALFIGIRRMLQGYRPARIFVLAFTVFLVVGLFTLLGALGVLPIFEAGRAWVKVGILLQLILLSLALGDRINALKEQRFRSRQAAIEAEAHSRATSEFLARMSHEIRTPMNGVLGMAELMADTQLGRTQRQYLDVISGSGRALLGVINDILDFSKIEAGHMELENVDTNLEQLLNECVSVFSLKADERNLEFLLSIGPGTQLAQQVDPTRLRQVILNLLGNAFKFTEQGHVVLRIAPDGDDHVRYEVIDSGIGVPESAQARLFDSFTQADVSTTRKYGGTGLGLAITRQLVELMGGAIGVDSKPGDGSTFWFRLPVTPARHPEHLAPFRRPPLPVCRVLLVTDRKVMSGMLAREMQPFQVRVHAVESTPAALRELKRGRAAKEPGYRVLVVDKHLDERSGLAVARELGRHVDLAHTEIVLMIGLREQEDEDILTEAGIKTTINYPLSCAQFRESLSLVLQVVEAEDRPVASVPLADYSHCRILVADDNEVNLLVARGMLKKLGVEPDTASNGLEALEAVANASTPYDFILMDCEMPELDGFEATRRIRALQFGEQGGPVIIALSAHVMAEARQRSLDAGMDDHMSKPLSMNILQQKLAQWTAGRTRD